MPSPSGAVGWCGYRHRPGRAGRRLPGGAQPLSWRKLRKLQKNENVVIRLAEARIKAVEGEFERAIQDEATRMVLRTRSGTDVNGQAFAPYSKTYAKRREKAGRNTSPVDLTVTGKMLAAVQAKVEKLAGKVVGTIFVNSAAEAVKAAGNQRTRPWFGLSDEQVNRLINRLRGAR